MSTVRKQQNNKKPGTFPPTAATPLPNTKSSSMLKSTLDPFEIKKIYSRINNVKVNTPKEEANTISLKMCYPIFPL